jgi:hypothetical protein
MTCKDGKITQWMTCKDRKITQYCEQTGERTDVEDQKKYRKHARTHRTREEAEKPERKEAVAAALGGSASWPQPSPNTGQVNRRGGLNQILTPDAAADTQGRTKKEAALSAQKHEE